MEQMVDEVILLGGNVMSSASRENIMYTGTVFHHHIPRLVQLLADVTLRPNLLPEELEEQKQNVEVRPRGEGGEGEGPLPPRPDGAPLLPRAV
jgi:predicted Zn-dependent peptidase